MDGVEAKSCSASDSKLLSSAAAASQVKNHYVCSYVPGYMMREIIDSPAAPEYARHAAEKTLELTRSLFAHRPAEPRSNTNTLELREVSGVGGAKKLKRQMYDCRTMQTLPGRLARQEGQERTRDRAVDNAYDGFGITYNFFSKVFGRNSIDDKGATVVGSVHFHDDYNNAVWWSEGQQMIFGDGDGIEFGYLADSLDVIAHELTHGVTEHTCGFYYQYQSGALNESISDVFACMVEQWHVNGQTAEQADWLLGQNLLPLGRKGQALRSLKRPGGAYDDSQSTVVKRKDRQVGHMRDYEHLENTEDGDYGGVHINSGIPNHAFYLLATRLGGCSWERAGKIWYQTMLSRGDGGGEYADPRIHGNTTFKEFAGVTVDVAARLFDDDVSKVTKQAWVDVGVLG